MANDTEKLRRVRGGIGTLETKCITEFEAKNAAGETKLGIFVPAGCVVIGAVIKNGRNDLAGVGASIGLKVGEEEVIEATAIATIKGAGVGGALVDGIPTGTAAKEVILNVTGAALTDGKLDVSVLYM